MRTCGFSLALLAATACLWAQPKPATSASGMFVGRSKAPMAGVRLILCEPQVDPARHQGKLIPVKGVPAAFADAAGKFTFKGFTPGRYSIVYVLPGVDAPLPPELDVSSLDTASKSRTPLLVKVEIGASGPAFQPVMWGDFTLLKGHTFWTLGPTMKVWNATARRGQRGPYIEVRKGVVWQQELQDKTEIRLDAWGF